MLGIFKGFVISIIVFNFFSICCESIICGNKYKNIYSFFSGLIIITIVISFIFRIKGVSVTDIFSNELNNSVIDELQMQIDEKLEDINGEAKENYKKVMAENIKKYIYQQGYSVNSIDMEVEDNKICNLKIYIDFYKGEREGLDSNISDVKEVYVGEIGAEEKDYSVDEAIANNTNTVADEPIILKIKREISIIYGMDMEDIYIALMEE